MSRIDYSNRSSKLKWLLGYLFISILGKVLSYFIQGDPFGTFSQWWLWTFGIILLVLHFIDIYLNYKNWTQKKRVETIVFTPLLILCFLLIAYWLLT